MQVSTLMQRHIDFKNLEALPKERLDCIGNLSDRDSRDTLNEEIMCGFDEMGDEHNEVIHIRPPQYMHRIRASQVLLSLHRHLT